MARPDRSAAPSRIHPSRLGVSGNVPATGNWRARSTRFVLWGVEKLKLAEIQGDILGQAILAARAPGRYRGDKDFRQLDLEVFNRSGTTRFSDDKVGFVVVVTIAAGKNEGRAGGVHPFGNTNILNVHFAGARSPARMARTGVASSPGPSQDVNLHRV
jgi:hypothetical protein